MKGPSYILLLIVVTAAFLCSCASRQELKGRIAINDFNGKKVSLQGKRILLIQASVSQDLAQKYPWWNDEIYRKSLEKKEDTNAVKPWNTGLCLNDREIEERNRQINALLPLKDQLIVISFLGDFNIEGSLNINEWCKYWIENYKETAGECRDDAELYRFITKFLLDSAELFRAIVDNGKRLAELCRSDYDYRNARLAGELSGEYEKYLIAAGIKAEQFQIKAEEKKRKADEAKAYSQKFDRLLMAVNARINISSFISLAEPDEKVCALIDQACSSGSLSKLEELPQWFSRSIRSIKEPFQKNLRGEATVEEDGTFSFDRIAAGDYYLVIPSLRFSGLSCFLVKRVRFDGKTQHCELTSNALYRSDYWGVYRTLFSPFLEDPVKKIAAGEANLQVFDAMVRHEPGMLRAVDHKGLTALHHSVLKSRVDVADLLIASGADINAPSIEGETPLHCSIRKAVSNRADIVAFEMVGLLLEKGANVNAATKEGVTPLHTAVFSRSYTALVDLLLKKGADVNARTESGDSPLHFAARKDTIETVRILLSKGADVTAENHDGETALSTAEMFRRKDIADLLRSEVEKAAKERKARQFQTAVGTSDLGRVRELLNEAPWLALWKYKDRNGATPLHIAAGQGNLDIVKLLLSKGAKINDTDSLGQTALYHAKKAEEETVADYLRDQGGK